MSHVCTYLLGVYNVRELPPPNTLTLRTRAAGREFISDFTGKFGGNEPNFESEVVVVEGFGGGS